MEKEQFIAELKALAKELKSQGLSNEEIQTILEIFRLVQKHKQSPMEFVRKDRFVICSDNYRMKTLSLADIQSYISKAKIFIERMNTITSKNEGLFR